MFNFKKEFYLLGAQIETLRKLCAGEPTLTNEKQIKKEIAKLQHHKKTYFARELKSHEDQLYTLLKQHKLDEHKNPWHTLPQQETIKTFIEDFLTLRTDLFELYHEAEELKELQQHLSHLIEQIDTFVFEGIFGTLFDHINKDTKAKSWWLQHATKINEYLQNYAIEAERHLGGNHALNQAITSTEHLLQTTRN